MDHTSWIQYSNPRAYVLIYRCTRVILSCTQLLMYYLRAVTDFKVRAHVTFDCSQRRIVVLTPRVSEELMRYQHGEHRGGAPRAQGAWTEPISDEILFVQVLTLFNFHA